eukprot:CAMPEP_0113558968 /NCGR_PEP_ID=MMETSP0015_2-20120614/18641_1 /TAXON_ID=2838 /ORGANISM="Odontella" /LENGTH=1247 /DNA_ID=CAMNT_0000460563 /DNA_START=110 /DNA_END=3853 /DNA_ORIENTATION=- /assembly_acc=CAM_ASM_000160
MINGWDRGDRGPLPLRSSALPTGEKGGQQRLVAMPLPRSCARRDNDSQPTGSRTAVAAARDNRSHPNNSASRSASLSSPATALSSSSSFVGARRSTSVGGGSSLAGLCRCYAPRAGGPPSLSVRLESASRDRRHGRQSEESRLLNAYYRGTSPAGSSPEDWEDRSGRTSRTGVEPVPAEVILLTGESGCGMTALADFLADHVEDDGGTTLRGKFDRCRRRKPRGRSDCGGSGDEDQDFHAAPGGDGDDGCTTKTGSSSTSGAPFSAISAAFEGFCRRETATEEGRKRFRAALEPEGRVLADVVPCLGPTFLEGRELMMRRSSFKSLSSLSKGTGCPSNSELCSRSRRLCRAFRRLVKVVARAEADRRDDPDAVLLLLDDIQWADSSTLDLICSLASSPGSPLFLVLTLREDEQGDDVRQDLTEALRRLEEGECGAHFTHVKVPTLGRAGLTEFVAEALQMRPPAIVRSLSNLIHDRAGGNMFFATQYMLSLHDGGFLYFDEDAWRWRWNVEGINSSEISCGSIVELMIGKIRRLSPVLQQTLKIAAFIGSAVIDEVALQAVLSQTCSDFDAIMFSESQEEECVTLNVASALKAVFASGLLINSMNSSADTSLSSLEKEEGTPKYRFAHDRIQQAAEILVPRSERAAFHLEIGRILVRSLTSAELEERSFLVADQMNCGAGLVSDRDERAEIADLNLAAGERAMASSAFPSAASYLNAGIDLLDKEHWRGPYYDICLALRNSAAECEVAAGNFDAAQVHINAIMCHSSSFRDELRAHELLVSSLGSRGKLQEAIGTGLDVLRRLGVKFPPLSSRFLSSHVAADLVKTKRILRSCGGGKNSALMRLPLMSDPDKLAAMRVLDHLGFFAYLGNRELAPLIYSRIVQMSVRHGICNASSTAFAAYGMILGCVLGQYAEMQRLGELALALTAKCEARECLPRVHATVYMLINPWTSNVRNSLGPLREGYRIGMEVGDVDNALLNAQGVINLAFHGGIVLPQLLMDARSFSEQMAFYKQETHLTNTLLLYQTVMNFMGYSRDPLILTGKIIDEKEIMKDANDNKNDVVRSIIYVMKLILSYHFNNYEVAAKMAVKSRVANMSLGHYGGQVVQRFYDGLSALSVRGVSLKQRRRSLSIALRSLKQMKKFARRCEDNCCHKVLFLKAELAAFRGRKSDAAEYYVRAIGRAGESGFIHEQALACERAGLYMLSHGEQVLASEHIKQARELYFQWGARAKVDQLDRRFSALHQTKPP